MNRKISIVFIGIILTGILFVIYQVVIAFITGFVLGPDGKSLGQNLFKTCLPLAALTSYFILRKYWSASESTGYESTLGVTKRRELLDLERLGTVFFWLCVVSILVMSTNYLVYLPLAFTEPGVSEGRSFAVSMCYYVTGINAFNVLLITGALAILNRRFYIWAFTACCLAAIPILGPCFILGMPLGIWGIWILLKPESRKAFSNSSSSTSDAASVCALFDASISSTDDPELKRVLDTMRCSISTEETDLQIDNDRLTKLPSEVGELKHLESLILRMPNLVELPHEIGKLSNLTALALTSQRIDDASLRRLVTLDRLEFLQLSGATPEGIAFLKNALPTCQISNISAARE